jgi:hypothetical protein
MNLTKIAIIVLVLFIALFVVVLLATDRGNSAARRDNEKLAEDPAPDWIKGLGGLFGSQAPKLRLQTDRFIVNPSIVPTKIRIPSADDDFRTATFLLRRGSGIKLKYTDNTKGADVLREQTLDLPGDVKDDPMRGSLTILKEGGELMMTCIGSIPCEVVLE